ncbi:2-phosphosulfolactate phosphatase [Georgenia sp. TF02-10]|uniref:2-phosphosulfolactate phosphatase n=1 Tax=Georgenia sp. TF02-10 TaxID=2917725 RepID=UPI001FA77E84|nr:2-phosphosulfolactate phosphatase [Georgenia sp. TF02-10]UNX55641.1 2-phosphosulfolactate phosphatase [Georgenia sp. TF02-10]
MVEFRFNVRMVRPLVMGMSEVANLLGQHHYAVRLDWGPAGARATAADVSVVVDVLSFSTSVCIAVERGMRVYPYPWEGARAEAFAREHDAVLAVGRLEATTSPTVPAPSLSPACLLQCAPASRLVLPSPNGSTIAAALGESGSRVAAGCLRNAGAVAEWLAVRLDRGDSVSVIAAGERWDDDDSLRPALEDHLGAGAILASLARRGYRRSMSPEALAAVDLFQAVQGSLVERMSECVSARELAGKDFRSDVEAAVALNASKAVPVLIDGSFGPAGRHGDVATPHRNV